MKQLWAVALCLFTSVLAVAHASNGGTQKGAGALPHSLAVAL